MLSTSRGRGRARPAPGPEGLRRPGQWACGGAGLLENLAVLRLLGCVLRELLAVLPQGPGSQSPLLGSHHLIPDCPVSGDRSLMGPGRHLPESARKAVAQGQGRVEPLAPKDRGRRRVAGSGQGGGGGGL